MLMQRDDLPAKKIIAHLGEMLEAADRGSIELDAEIATAFQPKRHILKKNGELFWREESEDGPRFTQVPMYTRSLDAQLPLERAQNIEVSGEHGTRWHATCDGVAEADAATEPLARRLLALKLIALSRRPSNKFPPKKRADLQVVKSAQEAVSTSVTNEDPRDLVILEMTETIKRLTTTVGQIGRQSDHEYFEFISPREMHAAPRSPQLLADNIPTLRELTEQWIDEKNPSEAVIALVRKVTGRFIEVNSDLPVDQIKKIHVRDMLVELRECPKSLPAKLKGRSLITAIAYGKLHPEIPKLAVSTINAHTTYLRLLLNWAFVRDYVLFNAASGLHVKDRRPRAQKRLPYTIDDLKLLFEESALYTGHMPVVRTQPGPHLYRDARFWLPLIALFTGARLGELMNLSPSDLRRENQIDYFDITKGATVTGVKSRTSERRIPVHQELLRIGIVDFFERKRFAGEPYLFADLGRLTDDGLKAISWHDKWRRINRQAGCEHPKKTFHSLRHSFKDACRAAMVPEEVHDALTGHRTSSIGRGYGSGFPLAVLDKYIRSLSYPGLKLDHLHV